MSQLMQLKMRQEQRLELQLVGGATTCLFERTYALLAEHPEYASALERLAELEVTCEYRSQIDLLFFELFPEWKTVRNWFYSEDDELPVGAYITREETLRIDAALMIALEMIRQLEGDECLRSWQAFRRVFRSELAHHLR